jgi:hypothetical protein
MNNHKCFKTSISNLKGELAGIPPTELGPYAVYDGHITFTLSPTTKLDTTSSQHVITCLLPTLNANGVLLSLLESNFFPLSNVPV